MNGVKKILCSLVMVVGGLVFGDTASPSTPTNVIVNAGEILKVASGSTFAANDVTIGSVITLTAHMKGDGEGYIIELWNGNEKTYDSGLIYLDEGQEWVTKTYAVTNVPYTAEKLLWWGKPCYMGETISSSRLDGVVRMDVTSQIAFSGKWCSTGRLDLHMEDATEPSYKIVDYLGTETMTIADYGRVYKFNSPTLYKLWVIDNDLMACKPATLSNVASITDGVTNATVVVKAGGTMIEPNADGTYTVPQDVPLTIDYTAVEGYVFDYWKTTKTVELAPLYDDDTLTAADKPVIVDRWADARTIDLDTRNEIVVTDPSEILPIAYSTNCWGVVLGGGGNPLYMAHFWVNDQLQFTTRESGFADWQPEGGALGVYTLQQLWVVDGVRKLRSQKKIYYTAPYTLTIRQPTAGGTYAVSNGTEEVASGDAVLAFSELTLAAAPDEHWQLEAFIKDGVTMSGPAFEMPLANVTLGASFVVSDAYVAEATNNLFAAAAEIDDYLKTILSGTDLVAATNDVTDARSVCLGVLLACKTPAAVDEAMETAIALLDAVKASHSKFAITYDAKGGLVTNGQETVTLDCYVNQGYSLPAATREGYAFAGWYTNETCTGEVVAEGQPLVEMAPHTLYAKWCKGFAFAQTTRSVTEGGSAVIEVYGGSTEAATQVRLSEVKGTGSYSAAYLNGRSVRLPLDLAWERGDLSPRLVTFVTTSSDKAEADKSFTLQLGSAVGMGILEGGSLCTVTVVDAQGGAAEVPYVRTIAWPANGGMVTGAGPLPTEKTKRTLTARVNKWSCFAGWYAAKADDPDAIDLASPIPATDPKRPTVLKVGAGTSLAGGTYYAYFTNVMDVAALREPMPFDASGAALPGVAGVADWSAEAGVCRTMVGVKFALPLALESFGDSKATLTAKGLPAGIKLEKDKVTGAYRLAGVPTMAGTSVTTFTAKNQAGKSTVSCTFEVVELPACATGTFYGVIRDAEERAGVGSVTFTAGRTGSLSAKAMRRLAGTRSFSGKGYTYVDAETLSVTVTNAYGEVFEAMLPLTEGSVASSLTGTVTGGVKKGTLGATGETGGVFTAYRNAVKEKEPEALHAAHTYAGTYAEVLYDAATNAVGTVSFKVTDTGSLLVAAKYAKGVDPATGKGVPAKTFSGTGDGAFLFADGLSAGGAAICVRSGTAVFGADVLFDCETRAVEGRARTITTAADKVTVRDEDQSVAEPAE